MVPIKEAINNSLWLHCEYEGNKEIIQFRIKVDSFRKLNLKEIDKPENIVMLDSDASLMIMDIEVVNLVKDSKNSNNLVGSLILTDQDEFNFPVFTDIYFMLEFKFCQNVKVK